MPLFMASSAWRRASFTAETTMSWSISASSGFSASGAMASSSSSFLPLTTAFTVPPPTEAVNWLLSTSSWALAISCCIFKIFCCIWACWRIMFPPPKPPIPLGNPPFAIGSVLTLP